MKFCKIVCLMLVALFVCTACSVPSSSADAPSGSSANLQQINLVLDWTPNTNHTGLYVAIDKGYYKDAGLDVQIQQPPEGGALALLTAGQAQFAITVQEEIATALCAQNPLDVLAVASIIDHNESGLISLKEKNIKTPKDMEGKAYATWDLPIENAIIEDIMAKAGADSSKLTRIPNTVTDVLSALNTDIDLVWVFYAWDGIAAKVKGIDINYIDFKELNPVLDFYTPVIASSGAYLKQNPEQAKAFLQATKKGYEYAIAHPSEAADILLKHAPELDSALVKESQAFLADKYQADKPSWGTFDEARWAGFYGWLYQNKIISKDLGKQGFTNEYIK